MHLLRRRRHDRELRDALEEFDELAHDDGRDDSALPAVLQPVTYRAKPGPGLRGLGPEQRIRHFSDVTADVVKVEHPLPGQRPLGVVRMLRLLAFVEYFVKITEQTARLRGLKVGGRRPPRGT
jgi:hypothetical protein